MFGIFGSQLVVNAASIVAKKAFETSVAQSLRGIGEAINRRYRGNTELVHLKDELEMKVKMLCLPVDICAHHVTQGNTALQEALGVALRVLQQIEQFQNSLVQHDISRAQGEPASPDAGAATARHIRELRSLITSLDSLLPYLNLAISAAGLLASAEPCFISPSRLMTASWHLRSTAEPSGPIFTIHQAAWYEERQITAAGRSMQEAYPLCSIHIRRALPSAASLPTALDRAPESSSDGVGGEAGAAGGWQPPWEYELVVLQELEDGRHHDDNEEPQETVIKVSSIVGIEWATTQSLNQGENEYKPALVLHVMHNTPCPAPTTAVARHASKPPLTPPTVATRTSSRLAVAGGSNTPVLPGRVVDRTPVAAATQPSVPPTTGFAATPAAAESGFGGAGDGSTPGVVRRYAIQCSCLPAASEGGGGVWEEEEEQEEEGDSDAEASGLAAAPSPEEWGALGELEYLLRLCILECLEQAPHYTVRDERVRMAFEATTVLPAMVAAGSPGVAAAAGARGSTLRRTSTAARRRTSLGVGGRRGGGGGAAAVVGPLGGRTASGAGGGGAADVDAVAAELGRRLAFSGDSTPVGQQGV